MIVDSKHIASNFIYQKVPQTVSENQVTSNVERTRRNGMKFEELDCSFNFTAKKPCPKNPLNTAGINNRPVFTAHWGLITAQRGLEDTYENVR